MHTFTQTLTLTSSKFIERLLDADVFIYMLFYILNLSTTVKVTYTPPTLMMKKWRIRGRKWVDQSCIS